ncbi:histone-lysine N-methyltransferase SETMAR-like [Drosophila miranda]|uniref:histone-lysine N-methyltransferase SETMAR-like n=1 Tax=Drosophila miranda TaxID=7229 RepID=UPI00143F94B2|nr:histone-lysine N-methyltransferase SETMAR-like [Drosophila miranda]
MEISRERFRWIIFHNFRRGLSQQECVDELSSLYGEKAPSKTTVYRWFAKFNSGRSSVADEFREGRPNVVSQNIDGVRELIVQDRHVTYREIEASLHISSTSIHSILHEHLVVKKVCSRWIPHNLSLAQKKDRVNWSKEMLKKFDRGASKDVYKIVTGDESWIYAYEPETKQQSTVWVFQDEQNPTKVVRARSTSKQMVACFFGRMGHVATVPLEKRRTVNSEWYTTICLPEVFGDIRKTNCRARIILHHDNASSHTSRQTVLTWHPMTSFYSLTSKKKLRCQRFTSAEEAVEEFKNHVLEVSQEEWKNCYDQWFKRMQKCIDHQGEYFEKQ